MTSSYDWQDEERRAAEGDWQDEQEALAQIARDRVADHGDGRPVTPCAVCGERPGVGIYGMKCRGCHEVQRAEREERW